MRTPPVGPALIMLGAGVVAALLAAAGNAVAAFIWSFASGAWFTWFVLGLGHYWRER